MANEGGAEIRMASELEHANTELRAVVEQLRDDIDPRLAQIVRQHLEEVFQANTRVGTIVDFSYGRALFVFDGRQVGGESLGDSRDSGVTNGAKKISGQFQRFDTFDTRQEILESNRTLNITEVCLVCLDNDPSRVTGAREIYYPVVNMGDEGLSFSD